MRLLVFGSRSLTANCEREVRRLLREAGVEL